MCVSLLFYSVIFSQKLCKTKQNRCLKLGDRVEISSKAKSVKKKTPYGNAKSHFDVNLKCDIHLSHIHETIILFNLSSFVLGFQTEKYVLPYSQVL